MMKKLESMKGDTEGELYKLFMDVYEMILFIHKKGITHGDTHLNNFMIQGNKMFVIDFGLSEYLNGQTERKRNENIRKDFELLVGDFRHILEDISHAHLVKTNERLPATKYNHIQTIISNVIDSARRIMNIPPEYNSPLRSDVVSKAALEKFEGLYKKKMEKFEKITGSGGDIDEIEELIEELDSLIESYKMKIKNNTLEYEKIEKYENNINSLRATFDLE
jgi:RIO-like serine/threonine protein kinase